MFKIEQGIEFTGFVRDLTAYRIGGDGIIVRKKGGAAEQRMTRK